MSLEECKKKAEKKLEKEIGRRRVMRHSEGMVDGEYVRLILSRPPIEWPSWGRSRSLVVAVFAYGEPSSKYFKQKEKDSAERYFEELTQKYGLKEEEKV